MAKKKNFPMRVWDYFRNSWEDDQGQASSKKLTLLALTVAFLMYIPFVQTAVHAHVFDVLGLGVAVALFNVTFAQLTTLIKFTKPMSLIGLTKSSSVPEETDKPPVDEGGNVEAGPDDNTPPPFIKEMVRKKG